ncbi:hypothetical protein [Salinicola socius]|nr:hypothetical protein [Salinicola socius]
MFFGLMQHQSNADTIARCNTSLSSGDNNLMSQSRSFRAGIIVLLVASLAGLAISLYAYFTPLTGVNGSLGALAVILSTIALVIMTLVMAPLSCRSGRVALRLLILLALVGTGFAGLLLHQWWLTAAMVVGLIGLLLDMASPAASTTPAHS